MVLGGYLCAINACVAPPWQCLSPSCRSGCCVCFVFFFFSSRRRHTRSDRDWSSDVCSSDLGVQRKEGEVLHLMWRVPYAPGTLRAVAHKGGAVMATAEVKTAGAPARITLAPDRAAIRADGADLSFVTVTVLDRAGIAVPAADQLVRLRLAGDARIVAVDNGDQISHAPFQADRVQLFNGKALVIIRAGARAGAATLTAGAPGLAPASGPIAIQYAASRAA